MQAGYFVNKKSPLPPHYTPWTGKSGLFLPLNQGLLVFHLPWCAQSRTQARTAPATASLTKWLRSFTISKMATQKTSAKDVIARLLGITTKHAGIEKLPVCFGKGVRLTPREAHVVQAIGDHAAINVMALANHFCVSKSAASQMVSRLVKRGLVEKRQAPHSNKELRLSLTDQGWKAHQAHEQVHVDRMAKIEKKLARFSQAELETTASVLKAIETTLEGRLSQLLGK